MWFKKILSFILVSQIKVEPNIDATREAIEEVAEVKKTFFGDMWSFTADNMEHADTAYTNEFLGAHNDSTYFSQSCRLLNYTIQYLMNFISKLKINVCLYIDIY